MSTTPFDHLLAGLRAKSPEHGQSEGESLTSHLWATLQAARAVRHRIGRLPAAEDILGSESFWAAVDIAGLAHDAGKIPGGFQDMVYKRKRSWGERHEVLSLGFLPWLLDDPAMRLWVATGVATHHRALTGEQGSDLRTLYGSSDRIEFGTRFDRIPHQVIPAVIAWLRRVAAGHDLPIRHESADIEECDSETLVSSAYELLGDLLDRWEEPVSPSEGLAAVLLQGAVTMADRLSSAHGTLLGDQPLDSRFPALLEKKMADVGHTLRPHQLQAAAHSGHLLLRAPTGSGKTEASLLWAARQVTDLIHHAGGVPRVFYTLPYLASINAMTSRLGLLLDTPQAVGVTHSRAAAYHLAAAIAPQDGDEECADGTSSLPDAAAKAVSRAAATRLFRETIRVGTPYQLLRGALVGPSHSGVLLDTANSVFIMDELHAYEPRRLGFILASATMWEQLGGRVAVLSATLPNKLAKLFRHTLKQPIHDIAPPDVGRPPRHRLTTRSHHLTDPAALAEIRDRLDRNESVLVVANNVAHALALFRELAPAVQKRHGLQAAALLHSRFRRGDRLAIERRIASRHRTDAERRPGLLVATQVVEVSLDVDFDVLFTAAAPLEALLQRFGRVNRVAARPPADVVVHRPAWATRRGGSADEFADGIYERAPVEAAWDILTTHDGALLDEVDATAWLNDIYGSDWGAQWYNEVLSHRELFSDRFLRFDYPFDDRSRLSETFDELFDGTEAILLSDRDNFTTALAQATGQAGRLLADDLLIPMPHWATRLARWDKDLKVRLIDGDYQPDLGLLAIRGLPTQDYQLGEVL
ncbi:CRISPR-associated helicase Cas3' [Streptomyces marincola]|uniref:CRISPR-associated helicase Cas3' n=1 Tax=Streptomyces marincola TaxID=2878388 RepID=UPI001CF1FEB9|nr:CRISPR-associated helicase Cas3' [Streptomyces marincola]UCM87975.1 CRISPR-associated helicase Cas3' [Streptomyces marincola]